MAARNSRIGRVIQYFTECDIEELRYVIQRGEAILAERGGAARVANPAVKTRRPRKAKGSTIAPSYSSTGVREPQNEASAS